MRKFNAFAIVITLLVFSCKKEEMSDSKLIGKWQMVQTYFSIGGPLIYRDVPFGNETLIQFGKLGQLSYTSLEYLKYKIKDSTIVTFIKEDRTEENYHYMIKNDTLTLSPAGPVYCIEGCGTRYKRVE